MTDLIQRLRSVDSEYGLQLAAVAADRIEQLEKALAEWLDKTDWVRETGTVQELGMHRADVLKKRIEQLERENAELRKQLAAIPLTQFPQSFRDDLAEAIRLGKVTIS